MSGWWVFLKKDRQHELGNAENYEECTRLYVFKWDSPNSISVPIPDGDSFIDWRLKFGFIDGKCTALIDYDGDVEISDGAPYE